MLPADWPELELLPVNAALGYHRNYQKEDPADGYKYASLSTLLAAPLSRGSVSISSANPADPPLIDPNYLSHPADIELAIVAIRRQREVWAQMQGVTIGDETLPGAHVQSDEDILAFVKQSLAPAPHAAGTCRMGRKENRESVVDGMGRVYGTKGLSKGRGCEYFPGAAAGAYNGYGLCGCGEDCGGNFEGEMRFGGLGG
ncbi:MAG: hypothetical protein LQ341_003575 [Variospora aurantia]|nr:MAG: hypothetical protein LQ341_003575 [Variospora aurantia]